MFQKYKFKENFKEDFRDQIEIRYGKTLETANDTEKFMALASTIMLMLSEDWIATNERNRKKRIAYYLSAEFLVGRALGNNLLNLAAYEDVKEILSELDIDIDAMEESEEDAALGNGGLGRLAACYIESAATLELPVVGYGVRYSEGLFKQKIENGFQKEVGDSWTKNGDPWSIRRESQYQIVNFRDQRVKAIPYDMPVVGYMNSTINTLRLWQAEAEEDFNFAKFNNFQYDASVSEKNRAEDITRVLYPNDAQRAGKLLRLKQQYFFVSASMQDVVKKYQQNYPEDPQFDHFEDYHIFQLNDTHPVIAIPELMRLLMDENGISYDRAWTIVKDVFAFTNHTILQEAMETWTIDLVDEVSPRCLEIIREIDARFVKDLERSSHTPQEVDHMRIISGNLVKMAFLAIHTSHSVNGVAELHTNILKQDTLKDWYDLYPHKFNNKTNGVTPRRWLMYSNPELAQFITELLGSPRWIVHMERLKELEKYKDDEGVLRRLNEIKHIKKVQLAEYIAKEEGIIIDPNSIFDIQIKRLHEYKRQLLNALHILYLYNKIKKDPSIDMVPRTFIFGAKAAPGYFRAKGIIKFINEIARLVNNDPQVSPLIKVVFVTNYRVSYGEKLFPAADVSEQISTAGKEASGTGNMKFMLNACPTLGTYDGANVEIVREAGEENNFIFGARVEELRGIEGTYNSKEFYMNDKELKDAVDMLMEHEILDDGGTYMFLDIYNELVDPQNGGRADRYFILKDFDSYRKAHEEIDRCYRDRMGWARKCLINLANSGKFSSDRSIEDYARDIWNI